MILIKETRDVLKLLSSSGGSTAQLKTPLVLCWAFGKAAGPGQRRELLSPRLAWPGTAGPQDFEAELFHFVAYTVKRGVRLWHVEGCSKAFV